MKRNSHCSAVMKVGDAVIVVVVVITAVTEAVDKGVGATVVTGGGPLSAMLRIVSKMIETVVNDQLNH